MFFWNKVEIYSGSSFKEFTDLRNSLDAAEIKYDCRTKQYSSANVRNKRHTYYSKGDVKYYLYIHQKDYDYAMHLTSNRIFK